MFSIASSDSATASARQHQLRNDRFARRHGELSEKPPSIACVRTYTLSNLKVLTDVSTERTKWRPRDTASQERLSPVSGPSQSPSSRECSLMPRQK